MRKASNATYRCYSTIVSKLMPPKVLLESVSPSRSALLDWLRPQISQSMLEEIAAADYGEEVSDHIAGIERQLSDAPHSGLLPLNPLEVLQLTRWTDPDIGWGDMPPTGQRGHLKRLLACTLLLQSAASIKNVDSLNDEEEYMLDTSGGTLIQLVRSALAFSYEAQSFALGLMLWLLEELMYPPLRPFIAYCAFLLWLSCRGQHVSAESVQFVGDWVDAEEKHCRELLGSKVDSERWLVGLNIYLGPDRGMKWNDAAWKILRSNEDRPELVSCLLDRMERLEAVKGLEGLYRSNVLKKQ